MDPKEILAAITPKTFVFTTREHKKWLQMYLLTNKWVMGGDYNIFSGDTGETLWYYKVIFRYLSDLRVV